jgi:biotin carboxyl carrier protein
MRGTARRVALLLVAVVVAAGLLLLYRRHRREVALESQRDAPVVAPSRVREARGTVVVSLDTAERRHVGLEVAPLAPDSGGPEARLPGEVVVERERAATLRAPITGRLSLPSGARWPRLGERVDAGVPIAQVSDARPLALPIGGVVTSVAAQPGALVEAGQVLLEVADFTHPLVRVVWLASAGDIPAARVRLEGGPAVRVIARLVGPAPEADPVTRRPAYLYRAERAWPGATPGTPIEAVVRGSGPASAGVLVPDRAVVQWEGLAWAYAQRGAGHYERVRVPTDRPAPGGWLVGPPLTPGDTIVVQGAEELLSEEFRARVTVGDESGE